MRREVLCHQCKGILIKGRDKIFTTSPKFQKRPIYFCSKSHAESYLTQRARRIGRKKYHIGTTRDMKAFIEGYVGESIKRLRQVA